MRRIMSRFGFIGVICIMVAIFFVVATKQDNLDVYNPEKGSSTYTVQKESDTAENISTVTYKNDEINLFMEIPDDWQKVTKSGYDTFIHSASATSVQIQVIPYYPMVNNVTMESLQMSYSNEGYVLTDFTRNAANIYSTSYTKSAAGGMTDYIEVVIWDRQHVAKILVTCNDLHYKKMQNEINVILGSIGWNYEDPIPEGYAMIYQADGDYEFLCPLNWVSSGDGSSGFYAYDESTGASLYSQILEDPSSINEITELDYGNFLSSGKQNFALSVFNNNGSSIYGEATYLNNGTSVGVMQTYHADGTYHYIVTCEFPVQYSDTFYGIGQTIMNSVRVFHESEPAKEEPVPETEISQAPVEPPSEQIFTPSPAAETEQASETEQAPEAQSNVPESEENVSTFSQALMQVAGITQEQADFISNVWVQIGAGNPVYAKAYKQNAESLILNVIDEQENNYFVYLAPDGSLQDIRYSSENGISLIN